MRATYHVVVRRVNENRHKCRREDNDKNTQFFTSRSVKKFQGHFFSSPHEKRRARVTVTHFGPSARNHSKRS